MFSFSPAGQTRIFRVSPPSRSVGGEVRKCLEEGFDLGFYGEFVQETKSQTLDGPSLDIFGSLKNFVADLFLTSFLTFSSSCHLCPSVHYVCSWGGGICRVRLMYLSKAPAHNRFYEGLKGFEGIGTRWLCNEWVHWRSMAAVLLECGSVGLCFGPVKNSSAKDALSLSLLPWGFFLHRLQGKARTSPLPELPAAVLWPYAAKRCAPSLSGSHKTSEPHLWAATRVVSFIDNQYLA